MEFGDIRSHWTELVFEHDNASQRVIFPRDGQLDEHVRWLDFALAQNNNQPVPAMSQPNDGKIMYHWQAYQAREEITPLYQSTSGRLQRIEQQLSSTQLAAEYCLALLYWSCVIQQENPNQFRREVMYPPFLSLLHKPVVEEMQRKARHWFQGDEQLGKKKIQNDPRFYVMAESSIHQLLYLNKSVVVKFDTDEEALAFYLAVCSFRDRCSHLLSHSLSEIFHIIFQSSEMDLVDDDSDQPLSLHMEAISSVFGGAPCPIVMRQKTPSLLIQVDPTPNRVTFLCDIGLYDLRAVVNERSVPAWCRLMGGNPSHTNCVIVMDPSAYDSLRIKCTAKENREIPRRSLPHANSDPSVKRSGKVEQSAKTSATPPPSFPRPSFSGLRQEAHSSPNLRRSPKLFEVTVRDAGEWSPSISPYRVIKDKRTKTEKSIFIPRGFSVRSSTNGIEWEMSVDEAEEKQVFRATRPDTQHTVTADAPTSALQLLLGSSATGNGWKDLGLSPDSPKAHRAAVEDALSLNK